MFLKLLFKFIFNLVILLAVMVLLYPIIMFAVTPIYDYSGNKPFYNYSIINPYNTYGYDYAPINFQAGTYNPLFSDTSKNFNTIRNKYESLGYHSVHFAKKYNFFTSLFSNEMAYMNETGFNLSGYKMLLFSMDKKNKLQFEQPFFQNINDLQYRIAKAGKVSNIIAIKNPAKNNIPIEYFSKLNGYHLMEILSDNISAIDYWDKALSSGIPVLLFVKEEFDENNYGKLLLISEFFAYISNFNSFLQTYAVAVSDKYYNENIDKGNNYLENMPHIDKISIDNYTTINAKFTKPFEKIVFSADNGVIKHTAYNTDNATYNIQDDDTYVRITAYTHDGSVFYFNPFMRDNLNKLTVDIPEINKKYTYMKCAALIIILIIVLIKFYRPIFTFIIQFIKSFFAVIFYPFKLLFGKKSKNDKSNNDDNIV